MASTGSQLVHLYLNGDVVTVVAAAFVSLSVTARRLLVAKCAREGTLVTHSSSWRPLHYSNT